MLERLHFVIGGCVGEGTQNSDRIVALILIIVIIIFYCPR